MKTAVIIGMASALAGIAIGTQLPKGESISSGATSVITFRINVPFDQWAAGFDSKEADEVNKSAGIRPLYRGVSTNDPSKVIVLHRAEPGIVKKMLDANTELVESSGHIMRTTRISDWKSQ